MRLLFLRSSLTKGCKNGRSNRPHPPTMISRLTLAILLLAAVALSRADPFSRDRAAFVPRRIPSRTRLSPSVFLLKVRGGATLEEDEESEDEDEDGEFADAVEVMKEEEEEEESESEEVEADQVSSLDASLAAAALRSSSKTKAKVTAAKVKTAKKAFNSKLSDSAPAKKSTTTAKPNKSRMFKLPYIVRALMNPFTVLAMTKAYWASLFNLDYLQKKQPPAQELRSALEEKAKRSGGGPPSRGRRKMKRGQAKTLSDLPQLNT